MKKMNKIIKIILLIFLDLEGIESKEIKEDSTPEKNSSKKVQVTKMIQEEDRSLRKKKVLKVEDLLENIEKNYPLLIASMQDMMIARSELLAAQGAFDTSFRTSSSSAMGYYQNQRFDTLVEQPTPVNGTSFFAGYRLGRGDFAPYYGERATNQFGEVRAGARIPILRDRAIDKNRAGVQQAEVGIRLADLTLVQQKIEITRTALLRYWDWISSIMKTKIAENIYTIAKDRQIQIEKRVKAGDLPRIEETENLRILLQRKAQLVSSEQNMIFAANELSLFLLKEDNTAYVPSIDEIPLDPFSQMKDYTHLDVTKKIESAVVKRPEIQRIHAQKEINRIDKELAKNLAKPGIDFVFAASQDFGPGSKTLARPELEASLVLNIPMQNRSPQGKIDGANAKNAKLESQEIFLRERISADIKNISSLLEMTRERVSLATREVELSIELEKSEVKRFQMGEGTLIIVNIREQTTAEAKNREIDSLADHNKALVNFKAATMEIGN
jgi:outer membrane protein, heavy metal efflux system